MEQNLAKTYKLTYDGIENDYIKARNMHPYDISKYKLQLYFGDKGFASVLALEKDPRKPRKVIWLFSRETKSLKPQAWWGPKYKELCKLHRKNKVFCEPFDFSSAGIQAMLTKINDHNQYDGCKTVHDYTQTYF